VLKSIIKSVKFHQKQEKLAFEKLASYEKVIFLIGLFRKKRLEYPPFGNIGSFDYVLLRARR